MRFNHAWLLLPVALFFTVGLGWVPLIDWDENIYAIVTRNIVRSGDFLHLTWNGQTFYEKPPLFFWIQSLFFFAFGVNEFAARLTTAVFGILMVVILYRAGTSIKDRIFGLIWAAVYFSSLIPVLMARMAIIDHMFNTFIGLSAILLYFYDRARLSQQNRSPMTYLLLSGVSMGLAVLAKGPLGGVIPLVAYASLKLGRKRPLPPISHVFVLGVLSLSIASSYFVLTTILQGPSYLEGFIEFQQRLFAVPLDSHDGPFFYHLVVGVIGFFPWTPVLLYYAFKKNRQDVLIQDDNRALIFFSLGWVLFVLVLFGIVSTKLPHYSASMYTPLSLLAALALHRLHEQQATPSRLVLIVMGVLGVLLGILIGGVPFVMEYVRSRANFIMEEPYDPSFFAFLPGLMLVLAALVSAVLFARGRIVHAVLNGGLWMGLFAVLSWAFLLPLNHAYNERPVKKLMRYAKEHDGRLALYQYLSFAVLYYYDDEVEVLHNYKFKGDPSVLDEPAERPLYVITHVSNEQKMTALHPRLEEVKALGNHVMYRLPAAAPAER